ncbi:MAG: zinc-finger domain-containing protein [Rhodocyclaceae bacterium]|nr:zinc-finger domain-containing protein [Rhodocyclaceae bacterium]
MPTIDETRREVSVTAADLPLFCPRAGAPLWARHPRVYLDVLKTGAATCPYCSTTYRFTGAKPKGHH